MTRIKLMADYGGTILWKNDASEVGPIDLDSMPLTEGLKHDLQAWADAYDKTLNQEYPPDSGFPSPAEEAAFEAEGQRLWRELRRELGPEFDVVYFNQQQHRVERA